VTKLATTYLGFDLPHPLIAGASPLGDDLGTIKRLEDAGAAAIVLRSLFEEQIERDEQHALWNMRVHEDSFAEALSFLPRPDEFTFGPEEYLEHVRRAKAAVSIPVIASLNGTTPSGWLHYAKLLEDAGASALELNVYELATDLHERSQAIEHRIVEIAEKVKKSVGIPVALKLSPFFTALPELARRLDEHGIDGLVLFNRFYQPDIDPESLEIVPSLELSDSSELRLRLRWIAILAGRLNASLCVSGGVHAGVDVVKALMAGAHAVQTVSALLKNGPAYIGELRASLEAWLDEHEYESVRQLQGSMSFERCPNPHALERANYMRILHGWRPERQA
jgi:dihydroorotate dehydrogenase (fumarate)